jgi:Macrocin-O-methyltransferase (TylF)
LQGLPVDWRPGYLRSHFNLSGNLLTNLLPNVKLVKGWFIDTLPQFLHNIDRNSSECLPPLAYLHVDSDIYESARDIFYLLGNRLIPGSIILFDELTNYPQYDKHEMKVLFEYMSSHADFQLKVIGAATPMHLQPPHDISYQSVAFVVV